MKKKGFSVRSSLVAHSQTHHGALDYDELERLGLDPENILDFSSNINPFGPPQSVRDVVASTEFGAYPDRDAIQLRRSLAQWVGVTPEQIVVGNGTSELIWLLSFAILEPGDAVLVSTPTFGEYARCASLMGAEIILVWASEENRFEVNPVDIEQKLAQQNPKIMFLCNPNNPTGTYISIDQIQRWAEQYPQTGFVIDEAYLPFSSNPESAAGLGLPNVIVLRSMTKDFTLAGLRLGFAIGRPALIQGIASLRPAWNVSAVAQAAGVEALHAQDFFDRSNNQLVANKRELVAGLEKLGFSPLHSTTHFFIVKVRDSKNFRANLLVDHHIQVRDCNSFGLPEYIRISTRSKEDNMHLLSALNTL